MASTSRSFFLLALVALSGVADLAAAVRPPIDTAEIHGPGKNLPVTYTGVDDHAVEAAEEQISAAVKRAAASASAAQLDGLFNCMIGCITTVMNCAFGCMAKGPDLPLCVISCNQKSIVCMIRCAMTPSPPGPKPPAPKPSPPKPPPPAYAAHGTETST
ncbi:uncharacterized protein LOC100834326 [Brachypodium distachyon]|uniref:Uncharacterized protein n=1 Tax=Brachypodium distachyon TaxID=15368 RepID=I1IA23_BRADI|nr:uncharacterized protein LOC100834326 [Brachypodium distachyon]KQJ99638.1 hypothetical protein BRADI_3g44430v3 [Brachypodium distachyon]|eukprot:XP_003572567.1 uncharacterized protein LOC100834326 [Brachypodium distachyon]